VKRGLFETPCSSQDSADVREQLKKHGARFSTDFILKARAKPYINAEIFLEYIRTVFLSNLNELRSLEEFAGEDTVLLMDNCLGHVGEEILSLLRDARVQMINWAPHTPHIFHGQNRLWCISLMGRVATVNQSALAS
jgi:hypothetical protein